MDLKELVKLASRAKDTNEMLKICSNILDDDITIKEKKQEDKVLSKAELSEIEWKKSKKYLKNQRKKELRKAKKKKR